MKNILIIKHGSLGDIISSTSVFKDIKDHFKNDRIFILTTNKFKDFFLDSPFSNEIIIDDREGVYKTIILLKKIVKLNINLVINLQNSNRTLIYDLIFRLFLSVEINGTGIFSTLRYKNIYENLPPVIEGLSNQIEKLGIKTRRKPYLDWLEGENHHTSLLKNKNYFIINPGCSIKNQQKKWSKENFVVICNFLISKNIFPILIGADTDKDSIDYIFDNQKKSINLYNKSSLKVIFQLANNAIGALSNDTGPAHLIAASGCKLHLVLSSFSNFKTVIPQGKNITFTQKKSINDITSNEVIEVLKMNYNL